MARPSRARENQKEASFIRPEQLRRLAPHANHLVAISRLWMGAGRNLQRCDKSAAARAVIGREGEGARPEVIGADPVHRDTGNDSCRHRRLVAAKCPFARRTSTRRHDAERRHERACFCTPALRSNRIGNTCTASEYRIAPETNIIATASLRRRSLVTHVSERVIPLSPAQTSCRRRDSSAEKTI